MLVSCHVCGRSRLCHHHPTFLCRQFASLDTEQSRLADGEWLTISPNRHQEQAFTVLSFLFSNNARFLPCPAHPKQSSLGPMPTPSATPTPPVTSLGVRHGPILRVQSQLGVPRRTRTMAAPKLNKRTSISHEAGRAFPSHAPAQTLAPKLGPQITHPDRGQ